MKSLILTAVLALFAFTNCIAQKTKDKDQELTAEQKEMLARIEKIKYQDGVIDFGHEVELNIPKGYKFLNKEDARYIVIDMWGNAKDANVEGMLVKENFSPLNTEDWAFVVSYEESGYIKDEDADKIDYDDLMKEIKASDAEENKERKAAGMGSAHVIGWAAKPFYDKANKCLHWAKAIKFERSEDTTLNYDVRVLGRKGLLSLNAVGSTNQLVDVRDHIPDIVNVAKFKKGSTYFDFDSKTDKIAAYTIGGLVAGKVLAKVGFLALILKNIKLVIIAVLAFFGGMRNKIASWFGGKKKDEEPPVYNSDSFTEK
jgi:uncharacterized membrane-anchored protein